MRGGKNLETIQSVCECRGRVCITRETRGREKERLRERERERRRVCEVYMCTGILKQSTETRHGVYAYTGILKPGTQTRDTCTAF